MDERTRTRLDVASNILVMIAALVVIAFTATTWLHDSEIHTTATAAGVPSRAQQPLPDTPHPLEGSYTVGHKDAKLAVIQYADFECPFCADFSQNTWPIIKAQYVDT